MRSKVVAVTDEEIHQLLRDIERQSDTPDARVKRPQAHSTERAERELTLDEILRKIQRDIANG